MAATETSEILQAIREMEAEERAEAAELLGPHLPTPEPEFSRRQFGGILAAVAGGSLSVQAAMAAINQGVMPVAAADGVVSDIDTLQSGDGSVIDAENGLSFDHENVSSATTIGNVTFIYYDSSVAGFTITIPASLEVDGMVLYFIDTGGSVASNNVTVTSTNWNVDGGANKSISANNSAYVLFSHSGEWRSKLFVDALATDTVTISNADGSTISGDDIVGFPATSSGAGLSFDTWAQIDANRPSIVYLGIKAETDGTSDADVGVSVDESGGTTSDYNTRTKAPGSLSAGDQIRNTVTVFLPAGAQIRIDNNADPNNGNAILSQRAFVL